MKLENEAKLTEIFRVILELDIDVELSSVRRISQPHWDSLAHMSIVAAVESEFGLRLGYDDMERMSSFGATLLLLEEKGL